MSEDLRRKQQVSVRLNQPEVEQLEGLVGFRGLWEVSDLLRAGLELLAAEERAAMLQTGETGARKRRAPKTKGGKR